MTGWLLYASLTLDNQSWVSGWELETLTITRVFTHNQIQNPEDYYQADTILSGITFVGVVVFFCLVVTYYYASSKSSIKDIVSRNRIVQESKGNYVLYNRHDYLKEFEALGLITQERSGPYLNAPIMFRVHPRLQAPIRDQLRELILFFFLQ